MKSYQITVNGKTYDVDVTPKQGGGAQVSSVRPQMIQPAAAAPAAPAATPAAAPAPAPVAGGNTVTAPIPGVVTAVHCKVGDKVDASTLLLVMEAMKMENEIFAGQSGTIVEVAVTKGQSVETGTKLVVIG